MALFESNSMKYLGGGIVGAVAVVAFPYVRPVLAAAARPLLKAVVRQSFLGVERWRERIARATETLEDIMAEVRSELAHEETAASTRATASDRKATLASGSGDASEVNGK